MSQSVSLKVAGLYTHPNPLSSTPDGSLAQADNIIIDRTNVAEPRRGLDQYGTTFGVGTDRVNQILYYKDTVLRSVLNTNLQYDSDGEGTFLNLSGNSVLPFTTLRLKNIETNGNLYLATQNGVLKLSAVTASDFSSQSITQAGGPQALSVTATPNYLNNGFLTLNSQVAYRVVWGINDLNGNLILGAPSARVVVYNQSTTSSCTTNLSFSIPASVTNINYFYQVYRTAISSTSVGSTPPDPGDEQYLVFENNVTSSQLTAGVINVADITPDSFRASGTLLYTNPQSGDGIASANTPPPIAKDIASYKNYTFYANTQTIQSLDLNFLSVEAMTSGSSTVSVTDGTITETYTFQGTNETYTVTFTGTSTTDFYNASPGTAKYWTFTSARDQRTYYIWYYQSSSDEDPLLPGKLGIKVTILSSDMITDVISKTIIAINAQTSDFNMTPSGTVLTAACSDNGAVSISPTTGNITNPAFTIVKDGLGTGEDATHNKILLPKVPTGSNNGPTTSQQLDEVAQSFIRVLNAKSAIVTVYYLSGYGDIPGQMNLQQRSISGPVFYLYSNVGQEFNPTLPSSQGSVFSTNEVRPNRVFYSKLQQPEAVPLANFFDIGPKDREIKRIIALRDSLFILKEDGVYRLSGDTAGAFTVAPFDFSSQVLSPDTAVILNNQIYALSTQGVIVITDTGVSVISRPIENKILPLISPNYNYKTVPFAISYETDRSYILWLPTNTIDTVATQSFRYNTFTNAWTRWTKTAVCGVVNFADNTMYLGAADQNFIEKERKSLTRLDYADRQYDLTLISLNQAQLFFDSLSQASVGDTLRQYQYLSAFEFNQLLDKLDRDRFITDKTYVADLTYVPGTNIRSSLEQLATKLTTDLTTNYSALIQNQSYSIMSFSGTISGGTVITLTSPHSLTIGRILNISGSSGGAIDGTFQIIAVGGSSTVTIDKYAVVSGGSGGTVQTNLNNFQDVQACFNLITAQLNIDSGVFFKNYPTSTGSKVFEASILTIDTTNDSLTIPEFETFLAGDITLYKSIRTAITWNPQFFQDPSVEKQVSQGTAMFENDNFTSMNISYSTDRSPSFEKIPFTEAGVGDWGLFNWGQMNWGGVAAPKPLRTLIPLEKQRCRFMNVQVSHNVALEKYSLFGISLTYRPYNIRTTR